MKCLFYSFSLGNTCENSIEIENTYIATPSKVESCIGLTGPECSLPPCYLVLYILHGGYAQNRASGFVPLRCVAPEAIAYVTRHRVAKRGELIWSTLHEAAQLRP